MIAVILIILSCCAVWLLIKNSISSNDSTQLDKEQNTPICDKPNQKSKQKEIIVRTLNIPDDYENGTFETRIAGISFHCDETDQGIFKGIIFNESNNPNNPNAMAIASAQSNKIVGYIPNDELKEYSRWCNYKNCPCVGFIKQFTNEQGKDILFGRVVAIKPCNESFVNKVTADEIECIEENEEMRYTGY